MSDFSETYNQWSEINFLLLSKVGPFLCDCLKTMTNDLYYPNFVLWMLSPSTLGFYTCKSRGKKDAHIKLVEIEFSEIYKNVQCDIYRLPDTLNLCRMAQRAHDVYITSSHRRCNVMTLHRR